MAELLGGVGDFLLLLADHQIDGEEEEDQAAGDLEGQQRDAHGVDDDLAKAYEEDEDEKEEEEEEGY